MNIGWIGCGKMGVPMARHLIEAGHTLTVYNRTQHKAQPLLDAGAAWADSPAALAQKSEVIFVMVSDDAAIRAVFTGAEGLLDQLQQNHIVVNTSTVSPDISREMSEKCASKKAPYVDAPVSGSVPQAEGQTLVSIVGGPEATVSSITPLLQTYSKEVVPIGAVGSGNATKLAVNTYLGIITQGLAEVIQFVQQLNVPPKKLMQILNNSALHSPFAEMKGDAIINDDFDAAFTLNHLAKDLRLAKEAGFEGATGRHVASDFDAAKASLGDEDVSAIIKYLNHKTD